MSKRFLEGEEVQDLAINEETKFFFADEDEEKKEEEDTAEDEVGRKGGKTQA